MGRRSVNTTKNGRFMNPSDQARKEARKRELKKNKKQRMAVRHAVLKSKDPLQLLEETSIYDKQEYDPSVQAHLNERVIQEKRRKLLETFDRVVMLYRKEDSDYANRLLAARQDYDRKRHEMMLYCEQVKLAERVKASEIPLPKLPQSQTNLITSDIPLPTGNYGKGILKKALSIPGLPPSVLPAGKKPPAPPPESPPQLSDSEPEDSGLDTSSRQRKIRFAEPNNLSSTQDDTAVQLGIGDTNYSSGFSAITPLSQIPLPPPIGLPTFNGPVRTGFTSTQHSNPTRFTFSQRAAGAVLSAPPSLHRDPLDNAEFVSGPAVTSANTNPTIEAKPQLKNLIGDATRFVPTSLKVRRTTRDACGRLITTGGGVSNSTFGKQSSAAYDRIQHNTNSLHGGNMANKDDAYEEFMREMENLM